MDNPNQNESQADRSPLPMAPRPSTGPHRHPLGPWGELRGAFASLLDGRGAPDIGGLARLSADCIKDDPGRAARLIEHIDGAFHDLEDKTAEDDADWSALLPEYLDMPEPDRSIKMPAFHARYLESAELRELAEVLRPGPTLVLKGREWWVRPVDRVASAGEALSDYVRKRGASSLRLAASVLPFGAWVLEVVRVSNLANELFEPWIAQSLPGGAGEIWIRLVATQDDDLRPTCNLILTHRLPPGTKPFPLSVELTGPGFTETGLRQVVPETEVKFPIELSEQPRAVRCRWLPPGSEGWQEAVFKIPANSWTDEPPAGRPS